MVGRTKYIIMSDEARVLKHLREKAGPSMLQGGEAMGVSGPLVSQIENGREDPPKDERLKDFLILAELVWPLLSVWSLMGQRSI